MKNKWTILLMAIIFSVTFLFSLSSCGQGKPEQADDSKTSGQTKLQIPSVRIGSKDFTESVLLSEIYALALEDHGFQVERVFHIANSVVHTTLVNDEIDLYPEYTGTGLLTVLGHELVTDPQEVYEIVKEQYAEKFGLVWLPYASANDSQGLVITKKASEQYGIRTITDLQANAEQIRFASQGEFDEREDGLPALAEVYGPFHFASTRVYDNSLKYQVLLNDEADVAPAATTEGQLIQDDFLLLEDDRQVWPPYNIAPVVRKEIYDRYPELAGILNAVNEKLDTETMTRLNAKVDVEKEEVDEVAKAYYESTK